MNIEYANTIALRDILSKLEFTPAQQKNDILFYPSPFSTEPGVELSINLQENSWYDKALKQGGNTLAFVCCYLQHQGENHTFVDALRWLKNMVGYAVPECPAIAKEDTLVSGKLVLKGKDKITSSGLQRYLTGLGIDLAVARKHLKELRVFNKTSGHSFRGVGLRNADGGYTLHNPNGEAHIRTLAISFIRGRAVMPKGVYIFRSALDYCWALTEANVKAFDDDVIILNSYQCMKESAAYIRNFGYQQAITWFDGSDAGIAVTNAYQEFFKTEPGLEHIAICEDEPGIITLQ